MRGTGARDPTATSPASVRNDGLTSIPAVRFAEIGLLTRKDRCNDFRCKVDEAERAYAPRMSSLRGASSDTQGRRGRRDGPGRQEHFRYSEGARADETAFQGRTSQ